MVFCQEHQFLWNIVSVCLPMWGRFTERFSIANLGNFLTKLPNFASKTLLVHKYFWKFCHNKINIFSFASMKIVGNTVYMPTCVSACFVEAENSILQHTGIVVVVAIYLHEFAFFRCKDKIPRRKYLYCPLFLSYWMSNIYFPIERAVFEMLHYWWWSIRNSATLLSAPLDPHRYVSLYFSLHLILPSGISLWAYPFPLC